MLDYPQQNMRYGYHSLEANNMDYGIILMDYVFTIKKQLTSN